MSEIYNPSENFWRNKRVLLTGHTGFKGAWLARWLNRLGAEVTGIGLAPVTQPNLFTLAGIAEQTESHFQNICDGAALEAIMQCGDPEIVFHLAAQALVRASYSYPTNTFATNVQGTVNVLEGLRSTNSLRVIVVITTDKVYQNLEWIYPYRETDALGGHDPYSASKAAAELVVSSYRDAFFAARGVAVASVRAGNVIGGGDWSEDRLIPDIISAWSSNRPVNIRRPDAVRPWQHVLEPLSAYLCIAEKLWETPSLAGAYNVGPETHEIATVREVVTLAQQVYGEGKIHWADSIEGPHESGWLALEIAKVHHIMGIRPRWNLKTAVERTVQWYRKQVDGKSPLVLCDADIDAFQALR